MAAWARLPFGRGEAFRLADDAGRLELLAPAALQAEARAAGLRASGAASSARAGALLEHARLLRALGARSGAPETLALAARTARAAWVRDAHGAQAAAARLEAARASLAAAELTDDPELLDAADERLSATDAGRDTALAAQIAAASAAVAVRRALAACDAQAAGDAGALADAAAEALARAARANPTLLPDLADVRLERAALLTGFALRLRDPAPALRAAEDMADLELALDPDRLPVLAARVARLRGEALVAAGELTGCAKRLGEASRRLTAALTTLPPGHAPVERARLGRALGHAARALAETTDDARAAAELDGVAVGAFAAASAELGEAGAPTLRAELAFERALALAGAALRRPEIARARTLAETALRAELMRREGRSDPAAWAAVQVALARLYAAEPGARRRGEAALALEAALEVFAEAGLRTLAASAAEALRAL